MKLILDICVSILMTCEESLANHACSTDQHGAGVAQGRQFHDGCRGLARRRTWFVSQTGTPLRGGSTAVEYCGACSGSEDRLHGQAAGETGQRVPGACPSTRRHLERAGRAGSAIVPAREATRWLNPRSSGVSGRPTNLIVLQKPDSPLPSRFWRRIAAGH